jgi:hypothetical protein
MLPDALHSTRVERACDTIAENDNESNVIAREVLHELSFRVALAPDDCITPQQVSLNECFR